MTHTESTSVTDSFRDRIVQRNWLFVELGVLLTVWYWLIGRWWSGSIAPGGLEYSRSMHSFYFWESWQKCGECAYWGNLNGGNPALQDAYGSFLHPFAVITSLQFGAITGSALTVALAFLLIALASWWFAYYLNIHVIVRVWFALANMMGGHMVSRLELGNIGLALSLASAWLAIVAGLWFIDRPNLVRAIVVAMTVATTFLAGQGYIQLVLVSLLPLFVLYARQQNFFGMPKHQQFTYVAVIVGLVVTITTPLWVNLMQPNMLYVKEGVGDNRFYQPITRVFANLLLDDYELAKSDIYNNFAYPWAYSTFIGISSVVFALSGLYWIRNHRHRGMYTLFVGVAVWSALVASGSLTDVLVYVPSEWLKIQLNGLRYLVLANGYLALSLLVMAMFAMHAVVTESNWWPSVIQRMSPRIPVRLIVSIGVSIVLYGNLQQLYQFNKSWIDDVDRYNPLHQQIVDVLNAEPHGIVRAPDWLLMPLLSNQYKMTNVVIPWQSPVNILPEPKYIVAMEPPADSELIAVHDDNWSIYRNLTPTSAYAVVFHADGSTTPCLSSATAGDVSVQCVLAQPGELRIAEFRVPGWIVAVNNTATQLNSADGGDADNLNMIRINLDSGTSAVEFRYRPWFATLSMYAYVGGWMVSLLLITYVLLIKKRPPHANAVGVPAP